MLSQHERTLRMKASFMQLHEQGLSVKEIAHKFDLASCTVYGCLQEIADANGVSRASLLQIPRAKHVTHERRFEPITPVCIKEFHTYAQDTLATFNQLLQECDKHIQQCEIVALKVEEEELRW